MKVRTYFFKRRRGKAVKSLFARNTEHRKAMRRVTNRARQKKLPF